MLRPRFIHSLSSRLARAVVACLLPATATACTDTTDCLPCLDTFVVYVSGEDDDWLGKGYDLEVEADGVVHRCESGGMDDLGAPSSPCGGKADAPQIKLQGGESDPLVLRVGFWRATPERVQVTLRRGEDVRAQRVFEPQYAEMTEDLQCPSCMSADSANWRLGDKRK